MGLICLDGNSLPTSRMAAAVDLLPQSVRDRWKTLLDKLPVRYCGDQWRGSVEAGLPALPREHIDLALVDDVLAEVGFAVPEDAQSVVTDEGVEICRFKAASRARSFDIARELSGKRIRIGETYAEIWASRFRGLAKAPITKITIVDRYALEQQFKCPQTKLSGIHRFLRELDRDAAGNRYVTLYSSRTKHFPDCAKAQEGVAAELQKIISRLPKKRIKRVIVYLAPDHEFGRLEHGRYVRFNDYIWEIDGGLEVLEGATCERASNATFKTGEFVQGYRDDEYLLRSSRGTPKITVAAD